MDRSSLASSALLAPALAFLASAGLYSIGLPTGPSGQLVIEDLNSMWGLDLIMPAVFFGGAVVALAVTLVSQLSLEFAVEPGLLRATARPRFRRIALVLAALSLLVLATLGSYGLAENWHCLTGEVIAC
jgi:hypothetical protein